MEQGVHPPGWSRASSTPGEDGFPEKNGLKSWTTLERLETKPGATREDRARFVFQNLLRPVAQGTVTVTDCVTEFPSRSVAFTSMVVMPALTPVILMESVPSSATVAMDVFWLET